MWARPSRELSIATGSKPPMHYMALVAETGGIIRRHREFIIFHSEQILPQFARCACQEIHVCLRAICSNLKSLRLAGEEQTISEGKRKEEEKPPVSSG